MAEFGKRQNVHRPRTLGRPAAEPVDLASAVKVVESGKLPHWAGTGPLPYIFMLLLAAGGFWWLILPYGGGLLRDFRLAGTWQPAYDMEVVECNCTRYQFIVTTCEAKIRSLPEPDKSPLAIKYMIAFSIGGQSLVPVRSTTDPSAMNIAYPAETKLLNRTLTLLALAGSLAALFLAGVTSLLRGQYAGGAAHRALLAGLEELVAQGGNARSHPRIVS